MPWKTWNQSTDAAAVAELTDMILALMNEVAFELSPPGLNEWFETGISLVGSPYGEEEIIVYYELQETDMTDVDGTMKPGYTLTLQFADGQQDTEAFFADEQWRWSEIAEYFANRVAFR